MPHAQVAAYFKRSSDLFAQASMEYFTGAYKQHATGTPTTQRCHSCVYTRVYTLVCIHSCVYSPTPRDTYCATTPGNTSTSFASAYKNSLDGEILFGAQNVLESSVLALIMIAFVYIGGRCESILPHESKRRLSPSATIPRPHPQPTRPPFSN